MLSVVTPVASNADPEHLSEAYTSLRRQAADVKWEWLLQLDTATGGPALPDDITTDPRVSVGRNRTGGPAVARTAVLARGHGDIVATLDADDQLTDHALADIARAFTADPELGWTAAPVLDRHPDGSLHTWAYDPPAGRLPSGTVTDRWVATGELLVHPSTLAARRSLLVAVGGWMALPVSEDVGVLVALDALTPGVFHSRPGIIRRQHAEQMTRHPHHEADRDALRGLVTERAMAMRSIFAPHRRTSLDGA